MKSKLIGYCSIFLLCLLLSISITGCAPEKPAATPTTPTVEVPQQELPDEGSFAGQRLRLVVPYSPGGGYDVIARSLQPYLEKHTGAGVIVDNIAGAGGNVGAEHVFRGRQDGLEIGLLNNQGMIMTQLFDPDAISFDIREYTIIARVTAEPAVMYTKTGGQLQSFEDVLNAERTIKVGMLGPGDNLFLIAAGIIEAFNLDAELIPGYPGQADVELAVIRGEVDLGFGSLGSRYPLMEEGEISPLILIGEDVPGFIKEKIGDVPFVSEFAQTEEQRIITRALVDLQETQRGIFGPPGIPEEIRLFLQDAIEKSLSEQTLIEEWEKAARIISFLPGNDYKEVVIRCMDIPEPLMEAYNKAVRALE